LINEKVLITGGLKAGVNGASNTSELYDPSTDKWTTTGNLNIPRAFHTASRLTDGKVLAVGGVVYESVCLNSAELYDPSTASWIVTDGLNNARLQHIGFVLIPWKSFSY